MPNLNHGEELSSINFGNMIGAPLNAVITAQANAALSTVEFIKSVGFNDDGTVKMVSFKYPKELAPYQPGTPAGIDSITVPSSGIGSYTMVPIVSFTATSGDTITIPAKATAVLTGGIVTAIVLDDPGLGYEHPPTVTITKDPADVASSTTTTPQTGAIAVMRSKVNYVPALYQTMQMDVPLITLLNIPQVEVTKFTLDFNAKIDSMEYTKTDETMGATVSGSVNYGAKYTPVRASLNVSASYQKTNSSGSQVNRTYSLSIHIEAEQADPADGMLKIYNILEKSVIAQPVGNPAIHAPQS